MAIRLITFLVLNFSGLGIGSLFTSPGVKSEWYNHLDKAPWTPPGWVFGVAWTFIMICFAVFMSSWWEKTEQKGILIGLYFLQWILNAAWNPVFFKLHETLTALVIITSLTLLIGFIQFYYLKELRTKALLITPYLLWLLIATSLTGYIWLKN